MSSVSVRWFTLAVLLLSGCLVSPVVAQTPTLLDAYPNLSFDSVTDIQTAGDRSSRVFVVEQGGQIRVFDDDESTTGSTTFLDLSSQVTCCGERGLLGLAFHPEYASNGRFFVNYTTTIAGQLVTRVSEFTVSADPDVADGGSETVLLEVDQPYGNHNAGQLQFGSDGTLFVGLGDGGSGGDPQENGQDPTTLLGTMLRLDVDGEGSAPDCGGATANYTIPSDNPFVEDGSACDEIYAYGFRNPFRFSFGPDGRLWVADVGQNEREEIDWVEAGENYGWNTMEGSLCYDPSSGCDQTGLELPVWEYGHDVGRSITGGYVVPDGGCGYIEGDYVFADFVSGRIWRLRPDNAPFESSELLLNSSLQVSTFGLSPDGTLLIADYDDGASIHRFDCSTIPVELTGLQAQLVGAGEVRLTWTTASETGNAGFRVEHRGPQARGWQKVRYVESQASGGTTDQLVHYHSQVAGLSPGRHEFRLVQVDLDGSTNRHDPVAVEVTMQEPLHMWGPSPNPVQTHATVRFAVKKPAETEVRIYNMLGQPVRTVYQSAPSPSETQSVQFDVGTLPSGVYVIRLEAGGQTQTRRMTIVR